jgi:4-hydroxy-2-oxoheptanedioate aldolase
MKKNHVRDKLKQGQPSLGTWLTLPDVVAARLMARAGFDWLTVELEHAPINWETAANSFAIIAASGVVPLARVPWNTRENIKRVLDNGAFGIVVPMVNSPSEAEAVVEAARYQPLGNRSVGGQLHAANFETDPATYYAKADEEILVVVMIEHVEAVAAADEILSVPGIDAVFIGPNDLLNSMGQPPAFDSHHKPFVDAVEHVLKTAHQHGIAAGMHTLDAEGARKRIAEVFNLLQWQAKPGSCSAKPRKSYAT